MQVSDRVEGVGIGGMVGCQIRYLAHVDGWCLACVTCVLLECKTQDRDLLAGDGVEHSVDDALHKPLLLVVINRDNLSPHTCITTSPLTPFTAALTTLPLVPQNVVLLIAPAATAATTVAPTAATVSPAAFGGVVVHHGHKLDRLASNPYFRGG
jgi:hypothetical protein